MKGGKRGRGSLPVLWLDHRTDRPRWHCGEIAMPAIRLIALGAIAAMPVWSAAADDDRQAAPPPAGAAIYKTCLDSCLDHEAGDWQWCNQQCSGRGQDPVDLPQEAPEPLEAAVAGTAWNADEFMTIANRADIERCIAAGADHNSWGDSGETLLRLAAWHGHAEALATRLNAGVDPHAAAERFRRIWGWRA